MLKATLTDGTIVFGLSDENLKRLKAGMPILLNLADLGLESRRVLIFSGKTEAVMIAELDRIFSGDPPPSAEGNCKDVYSQGGKSTC